MRAAKNSAGDDVRERYLGEIAPLLDAARPIDNLSEAQKKQVRKRIARTLFRTRFLSFRLRLVPALVALGMLVVGGAAFATAERLGLISKLGAKKASVPAIQPKQEARKRRGGGVRPETRGHEADSSEASAVEVDLASAGLGPVVVHEVTDPLPFPLVKESTASRFPLVGKPFRRTARQVAYVSSAPVMTAPAPVMTAPALAYARPLVPGELPAPLTAVTAQAQPSRPAAAGPAMPTPVTPPAAPATIAKPVAAATPAPRAPLGDQALFGQAMRKLRMEKDPAAALSALQEHARVYPRSSLGGERGALEVEALLALHRDRDALARLDTMALDELPRSGERFVVRGELRAAAHRWLEASADFDRALSRVSGSPAWYERALWGRGAARLRCGEREAGMADIEGYLDKYPNGRFATEAARFFRDR
jgi:hypothetical protein